MNYIRGSLTGEILAQDYLFRNPDKHYGVSVHPERVPVSRSSIWTALMPSSLPQAAHSRKCLIS
ncbi:MAG: hypothetical protein II877_10505 [Synergistaceae bacterium]|nr:hypothetical protein [Synergistaceae bacterium]